MRHQPRTILATLIVLAYAGVAHAGSSTTDNITVFTDTKAVSAQDVLRQQAVQFGLPADLGNLVLTKVQESLTGKHYHYQQVLRGLPVDRAEIIVSIGRKGDLQKIFNETKKISALVDADAVNQLYVQSKISAEKALDKGWTNMKVQQPLVETPSADLVWVATKTGVQLAHKVRIEAQMPTGGFVQYINAHNGDLIDSYTTSLPRTNKGGERSIAARGELGGAVLERQNATQAVQALASKKLASKTIAAALAGPSGVNGSGLVFDPDPRTALNTDALTDTSPAAAFDAAYSTKALRDLTVAGGVYKLSGPFVNISDIEAPNTAPSTTANGVWTAKRGNNAFDDSNVYFHIDQNQRYIQSLGFVGAKGIINRPLNVDTDGVNGDDNSHYSGGGSANDYLAFGHGCVNDSEDADVILHEYGHGIQANINSNWSGGDTGAMGEGFGDYWAASYSYSTPNGKLYHPEWAFSWDGHGACWGGRLLNRTNTMYNSTKSYSAHQQISENGVSFQSDELWSSPLYESMVALIAAGKPRANIDQIILEAHFGLGANIKMPAMATAIVNAAHTLFPTDPVYENTFRAKFTAQKILSAVVPPGPGLNETESNDSIATANVIATANTTVNGTLASSSDVDYFKVSIPAGATLKLTLAPNASSDYDLELYSASGAKIGSSTNGSGAAENITRVNSTTTAAVVYAKVLYYSGGTGATSGKYTLQAAW
ncbi:M36 family metallopeptidase [Janthinobacterium sp.]|uniref:M36 family metallopeptidase n=1 Tax=Janthinobacterium sp. TaxID=1871054 RepID=UPI00293D4C79|nr:M36 family metallopeptidase [Janthinobacterium sp.]